jgi:hypothetical protein
MKNKVRFLGFDVHAETIAVAMMSRMARCAAWERLPTALS